MLGRLIFNKLGIAVKEVITGAGGRGVSARG
jgi:hypothetical protein